MYYNITKKESSDYMVTIDDLLIITVIVWLIIFSIVFLTMLKNREKNMDVLKKAKKDRIDLEAITRNIETNYKPVTIELTSYEQEQENNAIISYDELVSNKDSKKVNYDDTYENRTDIDVKKVDLKKQSGEELPKTKLEVTLMNYEMEEAFLKALKQLQNNLAR